MAKKKENERSYLQLPLPSGKDYYKMTKRSWTGLNMVQTMDTGALTMERNISTLEAPYLVPSQAWEELYEYDNPISMFGFGDFLLVIYRDDKTIKVDYITSDDEVYTGILQAEGATEDDEYPRCVVQFNVYDTPTDPVSGNYVKKLLVFPDKKSMFMNITEAESNPVNWGDDKIAEARRDVLYYVEIGDYYFTVDTYEGKTCISKNSDETLFVNQNGGEGYFVLNEMDVLIKTYENETEETDESGATICPPPESADTNYYYFNTATNEIYRYCEYETSEGGTAYGWKVSVPPTMPDIKYATVHLSRLFGVDDNRVYASGYNDYTNWNLDTVEEYNESNAWCTPAQSNAKAGGNFTGITTFLNHVVCFKEDFMHEIYNTKNPFRIQDIYAEGAIDNRTIQDVDGNLIFVSKDAVKVYTGGNPSILSYYLDIKEYSYAVSGTDGRNYYLYCEDENGNGRMLTYDTMVNQWSEQAEQGRVISFAHNRTGMYALCKDGSIYKLDSGDYSHKWAFETDLIANETLDIKHVKRLQMLADMKSGSTLDVYFLYGDEEFNKNTSHHVFSAKGEGKRKAIRVKPRKSAHYGIKVHVEGKGYVKLYEMDLFFEEGGALYG